jgi:hypothetical protein
MQGVLRIYTGRMTNQSTYGSCHISRLHFHNCHMTKTAKHEATTHSHFTRKHWNDPVTPAVQRSSQVLSSSEAVVCNVNC